MSSGTKAFLAVFALLLGVLVIYYGMIMPDDAGPATASAIELRPGMRSRDEGAAGGGSDPKLVVPPQGRRDPLIAIGESALPPMQAPPAPSPVQSQPPRVQPEAAKPATQVPAQPRPAPAETPKPASTAAQPPPQMFEYTVKNGDTMSSIAHDWFGDANKWSLIAKANPLIDPARMQIGMKLRLPPKDARPASVHELLADGSAVYTVRSGDSLAEIAREYYSNVQMWEAIYTANRDVIGDDPTALTPGMRLTLPPPPKPAE